MDERTFDGLLRRALMDANLERFRDVLDRADGVEPAFSNRYLRRRMGLLADPFGWARRTVRPLWKKALGSAACVLLACTVTLGALMAVSPTVRAAVLHWLREISGSEMTYSTAGRPGEEDLPSSWRVTWLPEGWRLREISDSAWMYRREDGADSLIFGCYPPAAGKLTTHVADAVDADSVRSTVQIRGYSADYYRSEQYRVLVWEDRDGYLFMLQDRGTMEEADFFRAAESVSPYAGPDTAYEMGWVPAEYQPLYRDELAGAAEELWTCSRTSLTWRYVTDPLCPFNLPDGEPETAAVGGREARYWAGEETEDPAGTTVVTVGGETLETETSTAAMDGVTVMVSSDAHRPGTLVWTDPDTNTAFLLEGALDREELIRMAESVTEREPEPSRPSGGVQASDGTASGSSETEKQEH